MDVIHAGRQALHARRTRPSICRPARLRSCKRPDPDSRWNLCYNLVYHYTHLPDTDDEDDEERASLEMDHEAFMKANTKEGACA